MAYAYEINFFFFFFINIRKHFKTPNLIQCQFLQEDQILTVIDNEMDKSDQLACIRYKNQNVAKILE